MKKLAALALFVGMSALPALAASESFKDASVIDVNCSTKAAENPDSHTKECALKCEKSGFGIYTSDKKFLKFDADGNKKVIEALQATDKKDHLRADVTGDVNGDTIKVSSFKLR
jgi:hypothetical protein